MTTKDKALRKYVASLGALPNAPALEGTRVVVVPAFDEGPLPALLDSVTNACPDGGTRMLVVVNGGAGMGAEAREQNVQTLRWAESDARVTAIDAGDTGGVGGARRVGLDLAARAFAEGRVAGPWLYTTDADAQLPPDYFQHEHRSGAAMVFPFIHAPLDEAIASYELYLRHYVAGLQHARSPYAFHTVGSTIAVRAAAYAAVRGMPRRAAAEDFYFLNKVRKVGPVLSLQGAPIVLSSRASRRVPFGTGPAVARLRAEGTVRALHDFRIFQTLRVLRALAHRGAPENALGPCASLIADLPHRGETARIRHRSIRDALDGKRTRQIVHRLRDQAFPDLPWRRALQATPGFASCASLEDALEAFRTQQGVVVAGNTSALGVVSARAYLQNRGDSGDAL
ncbi:MAG: glycosyltransferase [Myxococcota bacterium]